MFVFPKTACPLYRKHSNCKSGRVGKTSQQPPTCCCHLGIFPECGLRHLGADALHAAADAHGRLVDARRALPRPGRAARPGLDRVGAALREAVRAARGDARRRGRRVRQPRRFDTRDRSSGGRVGRSGEVSSGRAHALLVRECRSDPSSRLLSCTVQPGQFFISCRAQAGQLSRSNDFSRQRKVFSNLRNLLAEYCISIRPEREQIGSRCVHRQNTVNFLFIRHTTTHKRRRKH